MISVQELSKRYGDVTAVDSSSFTINRGTAMGIIGPNGAGKTTTLKMLTGLLTPTNGSATINGIPVDDERVHEIVGFLPEENPVYERMTGMSYLMFFADIYGVPRDVAQERVKTILDRLDLEDRERRIGNMSKGMTRKTLIARSLIHDPEVVIYDEPASGLDPVTTNEILTFISDLQEEGKTVVFSAHNLHHVEQVCDTVVMMYDGSIVASGSLDEIREKYADPTYEVVSTEPFGGAKETKTGNYRTSFDSIEMVNEAKKEISEGDGHIISVQTVGTTLEDIFLSVTESQ